MNLIQLINQHQYLYLIEICEPEDNVLKLTLAEAKVSGSRENIELGGVEIKDIAPIVVAEDSFVYEFIFDHYIAYSVRNESYTGLDKEEEFEGRLACIYTKSRFLDYVRASAFASDEYRRRLRQIRLIDRCSLVGGSRNQAHGVCPEFRQNGLKPSRQLGDDERCSE